MNLNQLKAIVAKGESDRVEFKRSTGQRTEAAKTVCALANGLGGFVLFGVTDKGEIVGQQVATSTLEDVANEVAPHRAADLPRHRDRGSEGRQHGDCLARARRRWPVYL